MDRSNISRKRNKEEKQALRVLKASRNSFFQQFQQEADSEETPFQEHQHDQINVPDQINTSTQPSETSMSGGHSDIIAEDDQIHPVPCPHQPIHSDTTDHVDTLFTESNDTFKSDEHSHIVAKDDQIHPVPCPHQPIHSDTTDHVDTLFTESNDTFKSDEHSHVVAKDDQIPSASCPHQVIPSNSTDHVNSLLTQSSETLKSNKTNDIVAEDDQIPSSHCVKASIETTNEDSDDSDFEHDKSTYWHRLEARPEENNDDNPDADLNSEDSDGSSHHSDSDNDSDDSDPSSPESDNDGESHFSFNRGRLTRICHSFANHTVKEVLAIVLALSDRHNWTYEALIGCMNMLNTVLGCNYFPKSKKPLWQLLNRRSLGLKKHAYCKRCRRGLGRYKNLPNRVQCGCANNRIVSKREVPYFIELDLRSQLNQFLARPDAAQFLFSRENRQKHNADALEDIYDGSAYQELRFGENPVLSANDFSYTFNSDGFSCTKTSHVQVHPIYVKINELPQNVRQKHLFLAGVWIDRGDPDMVLYLEQCLVGQGNKLATDGITWNAGERGVITSKFIPTCCCVDSKARCIMLNMIGPTGYFGCTFCYIQGVRANGVHFPFDPAGMPELRTNAELEAAMLASNGQPENHQGVKGVSPLMNLLHFDLGNGMSTDDLHPLYEGVVQFHMDILLTDNNNPAYYIGAPQTVALINFRLLSIKPPKSLSRTPRGLDTREKWRGHEWRNWILYYVFPCLLGLLPARYLNHLKKLSRAIFLVSKDSITEEELEEAHEHFIQYVQDFQLFFGVERMRFNIHVLLHVVHAVRLWGPLHSHSTFNFESWNMKLRKHIKSMKDPLLQIVNRHLIHSFIASVPFDNDNFSPQIQAEVASILTTADLKTAVRVGEVFALGLGHTRQANNQERAALEVAGIINFNTFTVYERALYRGMDIRSTDYRRSSKNNNAFFYSWTDSFCKVKSLATIRLQNGNLVCILFVQELEVQANDNILAHIALIGNEQDDDLTVYQFEDVRVMSVYMQCAGYTYIMPMANCIEID